MTQTSLRIGVDLGGTKIEAVALDHAGKTLALRRVVTPAHDYAEILRAIGILVREIEFETGLRGAVGVGAPGAISSQTGLVKNSNTAVLNGNPLDVDLARALGRPVRVENDANCFALSEAVDGAGSGARVVFGVILGTGVGGGIVVNGKSLNGPNHVAGEWGHTPLPWMTMGEFPGQRCFCGHHGCIETFLSGPGLARDYFARSGVSVTGAEVFLRADQGETAAKSVIDAYQDRLARALALIVNIIDPDVIVLGGGVSNAPQIYEGLFTRIAAHAFTDALETKIRRNVHGDSSGVRGAAWLCRDDC